MKMMAPFTALLLAACATTGSATPTEGPVALGETAYAGGPTVKPVEVIQDSRCPERAMCYWAGRVIVRAVITTGRGPQTRDLTLGQPVPVADGQLTLVKVTPDRTQGSPIEPGDYRFIFDFQGGL